MKKTIIYILSILAMASCVDKSTPDVELPVPGDDRTYVAPLEINVGVSDTRAFDEDLKWSWESTDKIYGYQVAGTKTVNTLTLKENDRFGTEEFTYASQDPATFHFVYAGDAVLDATASGNRAITQNSSQSGKWSPVLVGSAINKTFTQVNSDNTTIGLEHLSAALEVRLWKDGVDKNSLTDADKKNIVYAELMSDTENFLLDIIPTYNQDGTVTYSQRERGQDEDPGAYIRTAEVNSPTVVFNIAPHAENYSEGDLTLAIIDENGDRYVLAVPALNFVAGKRTILNVEWVPQTSAYLPEGPTFNSTVDAFMTGKGITAIKFITNSNPSRENVLVDGSIYLVQNENTLEIHTAASQYVANSNCRKMFDARLSYDSNTHQYTYNSFQQITSIDFSHSFNTKEVTDMCCMFYGCSGLTALDINHFNTENVTNIQAMFYGCSKLTSLDLSNFNTEKVTDMSYMFYDCYGLTSLDVSNFNTEKVTNMSYMFRGCSNLASLNIGSFNTQSVKTMSDMFYGCSGLTSLDVSKFNTENVTDMWSMFEGCSGLASLDVSYFNTEKVTKMVKMFSGCSSLTSLDVSNFDTQKVTDMSYMFQACSKLTSLDVSNFNTQNVTDMRDMFSLCSSLTSLDVSKFNTENVTNMSLMFNKCSSLTSLDVSKFNTQKVTDMREMFWSCSSLTSLDVSKINTENVTNMSLMFDKCSSLTSLDVSHFNTQKVTDMAQMFYMCSKLTSLDVSNFNTQNVTDMRYMFSHCISLTSLDISNFTFTSDPAVTRIFRFTGGDAENKPIPIYVTATGKQYIENKGDSEIDNSYAVLTVYDESGFGVPDGENNGDENWKN